VLTAETDCISVVLSSLLIVYCTISVYCFPEFLTLSLILLLYTLFFH